MVPSTNGVSRKRRCASSRVDSCNGLSPSQSCSCSEDRVSSGLSSSNASIPSTRTWHSSSSSGS